MKDLSRRDFIRMASLASLAALAPAPVALVERLWNDQATPSVIILIFDAMSARNLSLYGYQRNTSPNLERFAGRAVVFHNHSSGGNYTTPGTATILTGTYPWTHRAINQAGLILYKLTAHNIFSGFVDGYHTFAFSQNLWADYLLNQFENDVDSHLLPGSFCVAEKSFGADFPNDINASTRAFDDFLFQVDNRPASLIFGPLERQLFVHRLAEVSDKGYARGLPHDVTNPKYFRLEDVFNGVYAQLAGLPMPFFSYVHLYAPHEPYRPRAEFENIFKDNWKPAPKPVSRFSDGSTNSDLLIRRVNYDEYIANVDYEFGRLMDALDKNGILDSSIVVVTSDHGQLFERGVHGHTTPLLFDPVVHVPLLVSLPGQATRRDIYAPTSHVDILPTLLHLTGREIPSWCEGRILPGLGGGEDHAASIFLVEAKGSSVFAPFRKATVAIRRNNLKLSYFFGYDAEPWYELYDLEADPEELTDLYPSAPSMVSALREELVDSLEDANRVMEETK